LGSEGRKGKREMKQGEGGRGKGEGGCIYLSEREKGERREERGERKKSGGGDGVGE